MFFKQHLFARNLPVVMNGILCSQIFFDGLYLKQIEDFRKWFI